MKEIKLNLQGKKKHLNLIAIVDDEDFESLNKWRWYAHWHRNTYYVRRGDRSTGKLRLIGMHRQLLNVSDPKILVDHRDRNGLNNQKANLRTCTTSENCANGRSKKHSTSKYLGVCLLSKSKKWEVKISKNRKGIYIGRFNSEEEAARAYDKKAVEIHGEFANLNFKTA